MDNKLWLYLGICTLIGLLIGLPRLLTYLQRWADMTRQELDAVSSGSAYDGMLDAQEEEPTQPLEVVLLEEMEHTYAGLQAQAYARCLQTLLTTPRKPEDTRKGA